jgi:hypothetical protein
MKFDIENAVADCTRELINSGALTAIIEARIKKTLDEIVSEALRSYGSFGQQLKEMVQSALKVDLSNLDLQCYNQIVLNIVKSKLRESVESSRAHLTKGLEELLGTNPPAEIKLSKLIGEFKKWAFRWSGQGRCTIILEEKDTLCKSRWFYLDRNPNVNRHNCSYRFLISEDGRTACFRIEGKELEQNALLARLDGFSRTLFQIQAAGTKVIIDREHFNNELHEEDHEEEDEV